MGYRDISGKSYLVHVKKHQEFEELIADLNVRFGYRSQNELETSGSFIYLKTLTPEECDAQGRSRMSYVEESLGELDITEYHNNAEQYLIENQGEIYEFINFERFMQILEGRGKSLDNIYEGNRERLRLQYGEHNTGVFGWRNSQGTCVFCPDCCKGFFVHHIEPLEDDESLQCPNCHTDLCIKWEMEPVLRIYRAEH